MSAIERKTESLFFGFKRGKSEYCVRSYPTLLVEEHYHSACPLRPLTAPCMQSAVHQPVVLFAGYRRGDDANACGIGEV